MKRFLARGSAMTQMRWISPVRWLVAFALTTALSVAVSSPASAVAALGVRPSSGPAGSPVRVHGSGYLYVIQCPSVTVYFTDADGSTTSLGKALVSGLDGTFKLKTHIPGRAAPGVGTLLAYQPVYDPGPGVCGEHFPPASAPFTVTGPVRDRDV